MILRLLPLAITATGIARRLTCRAATALATLEGDLVELAAGKHDVDSWRDIRDAAGGFYTTEWVAAAPCSFGCARCDADIDPVRDGALCAPCRARAATELPS